MTDAGSATPRVIARSLIHRGRKFDFELLTVQRPGGRTIQREVVRHPGAVVIVPVLETGGGKSVVLIRNFRITVEQPLLECCAGTIERPRLTEGGFGPGEAPELCAARELIEETGYKAAKLHDLGWYYTTPGLTDERMFAYAATGLTHVGQHLEEDETIQVEIVPAARAVEMVSSGEMRDAKSMLAVLLARRAGFL
jgi:ADP-ribose pyrophosphatase